MPNKRHPKRGTMQYWPRKRASRLIARTRSFPAVAEPKLLGFIAYKVGMTSVQVKDNRANSLTKGQAISIPVTVLECPPVKVLSVRLYKNTYYGKQLFWEIFVDSGKSLKRLMPFIDSKKGSLDKLTPELLEGVIDARAVIYTQPNLISSNKKTPELLEVAVGGKSVQEKIDYLKSVIGKPISAKDFVSQGKFVDVRGVTKGKGYQGPVKRFGVDLRSHKAEKTKRGPGSLGSWGTKGHFSYRVPLAGQMGFHQRTEHNKLIVAIEDDPAKVNVKGGYLHYGLVRNPYILIKGSVFGSQRRPVVLTQPLRQKKPESYELRHIDLGSNQ